MKRLFLLPLACVMLFGMVGCSSDTHEDVTEDLLKAREDFAEVLKTIKDEDSANAAVSDMEAISDRLRKIKERMEALDDLSVEEQAALQKTYEDRDAAVLEESFEEIFRIMALDEGVYNIFLDAMEDMPSIVDSSDDE